MIDQRGIPVTIRMATMSYRYPGNIQVHEVKVHTKL